MSYMFIVPYRPSPITVHFICPSAVNRGISVGAWGRWWCTRGQCCNFSSARRLEDDAGMACACVVIEHRFQRLRCHEPVDRRTYARTDRRTDRQTDIASDSSPLFMTLQSVTSNYCFLYAHQTCWGVTPDSQHRLAELLHSAVFFCSFRHFSRSFLDCHLRSSPSVEQF